MTASTSLTELQAWYRSQCNDDWEHSYGVKIETLDNPGWSVTVDLTETELQDREFKPVARGAIAHDLNQDRDWIVCKSRNCLPSFRCMRTLTTPLTLLWWPHVQEPT